MSTITTTELSEGLDDPRRTVVDIRPLASLQRMAPERRGPRRPHPRRRRVPGRLAADRRRGRGPAPPGREGDHHRPRRRRLRRRSGRRDRVRRGPDRASASTVRAPTRAGPLPGPPIRRCRSSASPNYEKLVHIPWLRDVLDGKRPEAPPNEKFLLFHVNFGVPEEYAEGHIPGALFLDTNWLEDPVDWNRRSPEVIEAALRSLGITRRHDGRRLRSRHRGRRQGEVAGPTRRPDRRDPGADDPALRRRR